MTTRTLLKKWPLVVVLFASACLDFQTVSRGVVEHVPTAAAYGGSAPWLIDADVTLDTGTLVPPPSMPKGVEFVASAQVAPGPELAILRLSRLEVKPGVRLRVVGVRPLVIIASNEVVLAGVLDASADGPKPGPGAMASGSGVGGTGGVYPNDLQTGGGGGGFGREGGAGGAAASTAGPLGGLENGDARLTVLFGGSPGGPGGVRQCKAAPPRPGAGGGAVQVTAGRVITVTQTGNINAGGGGGEGSGDCETGAGQGGGSGGAIVLEAPVVVANGFVTANGGGGGGGSTSYGDGFMGQAGQNGLPTPDQAKGGPAGTTDFAGSAGGAGGSVLGAAAEGHDSTHDAGGGGGSVGRIVVKTRSTLTLTSFSPQPTVLTE